MPIRKLPHTRFARANRRGGGKSATGAGQSFNGTDQYAYVADNGDLDVIEATTDFCFGGYIKTGSDITLNGYVLGKNTVELLSGRYGITIKTGTIRFYVATSDGLYLVNDDITLAINTEYFVVCRIDITNSKLYFYIDKTLQNPTGTDFTGTISNLANDYKFYLASGNDDDASVSPIYFANCKLRDIRVYNKDVTSLENQTKWMNGEPLEDEVAWWDLPKLIDYSGNGYDLTGVNL